MLGATVKLLWQDLAAGQKAGWVLSGTCGRADDSVLQGPQMD